LVLAFEKVDAFIFKIRVGVMCVGDKGNYMKTLTSEFQWICEALILTVDLQNTWEFL
jgi:hypothetical protein